MRIACFDCFSGAAGDMIVAALLDAGGDADALREGLASLGLTGYELNIAKTKRGGLSATRFAVTLTSTEKQSHRHLPDIVRIIEAGRLPEGAKRRARAIFERLAAAEAAVHGVPVEQVHFHEVGAVDAIVDVVGASLALELLKIDEVHCSPVVVGSGTVTCAHGVLPIPAPATAELLKGVPILAGDEAAEMTTPTGAAVLTTVARSFGPLPELAVEAIGYGAGTREGLHRPNVLRVLIGTGKSGSPAAVDVERDQVTVLETQIDDSTGQVVGHCMERLLEAGALDVFAVPIHMKKSRPGLLLTVLCTPDQETEMERLLFAETSTLGVRRQCVSRIKLRRHHAAVDTPFGSLGVKVAEGFGTRRASPELEDCRRAAEKHGVPLRIVLEAAQSAWARKEAT